MKYEIHGNPDFGHVHFTLAPSESVLVESGAMSAMSSEMDVRTRLMGGLLRALMRRVLAGESLLVGEYSSEPGGQLSVSPGLPGVVLHRRLDGREEWLMQAGSFLACTPGVEVGTRFGGLRAIFSGEGLFFLHVSGTGDLFYNAYGSIVEKDVDGRYVVDTGHIVAWEPALGWRIRGMGNLFSTFFSGEGLVIEFTGRGKVLLQTRSFGGLAHWLGGYCR